MRDFWEQARARDEVRRQSAADRYNCTVLPKQFEWGDLVLLRDHYPSYKLDNKWVGPLTVTRVNHSGTYYLTGPFSRRLEGAVNGDQLRLWFMRSSMRSWSSNQVVRFSNNSPSFLNDVTWRTKVYVTTFKRRGMIHSYSGDVLWATAPSRFFCIWLLAL
jgi:hypothetical protein